MYTVWNIILNYGVTKKQFYMLNLIQKYMAFSPFTLFHRKQISNKLLRQLNSMSNPLTGSVYSM